MAYPGYQNVTEQDVRDQLRNQGFDDNFGGGSATQAWQSMSPAQKQQVKSNLDSIEAQGGSGGGGGGGGSGGSGGGGGSSQYSGYGPYNYTDSGAVEDVLKDFGYQGGFGQDGATEFYQNLNQDQKKLVQDRIATINLANRNAAQGGPNDSAGGIGDYSGYADYNFIDQSRVEGLLQEFGYEGDYGQGGATEFYTSLDPASQNIIDDRIESINQQNKSEYLSDQELDNVETEFGLEGINPDIPLQAGKGDTPSETIRNIQADVYPKYVEQGLKAINEPYQPYQGQRIADFTQAQQTAMTDLIETPSIQGDLKSYAQRQERAAQQVQQQPGVSVLPERQEGTGYEGFASYDYVNPSGVESILRDQGYTGEFGEGGGQQYYQNLPETQQEAVDSAIQARNVSNRRFDTGGQFPNPARQLEAAQGRGEVPSVTTQGFTAQKDYEGYGPYDYVNKSAVESLLRDQGYSGAFGEGGGTQYYQNLSGDQQTQIDNALRKRNERNRNLGVAAEYMNPYTEQVIDATERDMREERQKALNRVGQKAGEVGAFGGSRLGIREAETVEDNLDRMSEMQAKMRADAYRTGADIYAEDRGRALRAAQGNQDAFTRMLAQDKAAQNEMRRQSEANRLDSYYKNIGLGLEQEKFNRQQQVDALSSATDFYDQAANMQGAAQSAYQDRAEQKYGIGSMQQQMDQENLNLAYSDFLQQRDYPLRQAQQYGELIGESPFNTTSASQDAYRQAQIEASEPSTLDWVQAGSSALGSAGNFLNSVDSASGLFGFAQGGSPAVRVPP